MMLSDQSFHATLPALLLCLCCITTACSLQNDELAVSASGAGRQAEEQLPALWLSFVGDIMAHPPNFTMSDYDRIYRAVSELFLADDLSFANLEFVVDEQRPMAGFPRFNVHGDYVASALRAGFDVFSLANNHSNDYGKNGILQTQRNIARFQAWISRPLYVSGLRADEGSSLHIQSIHYRNWHIGFLALTGLINQYNDGNPYLHYVPENNDEANEELRELVRSRRGEYDLFILSWHGGTEYLLKPNEGKSALFRALMEAGVDILWGHHPHVLQPVEFYFRSDGRRGVIMYSMGNFISSQPWYLQPDDRDSRRAYTGDSAVVQLKVQMTAKGADVPEMRPVPITHLQHFDPSEGSSAGDLRDGFEVHYTGEAEAVASEPWKPFYRRRTEVMLRLIDSFTTRYHGVHQIIP